MSEHRRDQSIDRLLKVIPEGSSVGSSAACLDAEMLAAWADDNLPGPMRATVESHAASCPRCQSMLAAFVRTAEVASALNREPAPTRLWISRVARWAAPLTAAAAVAVVLWAVMPRVVQDPQPESQPVVAVPAPTELEAPKQTAAAQPADAPMQEKSEFRQSAGARRDQSKDAQKRVAAERDQLTRERAETNKLARADAREPMRAQTPPPPAPPTTIQAAQRSSEPARLADRGGALAESIVVAAPIEIGSPDPKFRWRIVKGNVVEQSNDGGMTWLNPTTHLNVVLLSGSAPSPTVCWIVGSRGTVLLTTDGRVWQRVAFPETVDLVSVKATTADAASVTTVDGRLFVTSDGGRVWKY
jgi:hypothetical protein